jgi:uncharacterized protein YjiS (DUF1127 family)
MTNIDTQLSASADISSRIGDHSRISLRDAAKAAVDGFGTLVNALLDWQERARQRRMLLSLGDRALQDFGASRADAAAEGDKPFWRA